MKAWSQRSSTLWITGLKTCTLFHFQTKGISLMSDLCSLLVQWMPLEEATKTVVKKCVDLGPLAWKKLQSPGQ